MPNYVYECECGKYQERSTPIEDYVPEVPCECGKSARRSYGFRKAMLKKCGGWPLQCAATGCLPSQAAEFEENARKHGVPVRFDRATGDAIYESRQQRKAYFELMGYRDNIGGYGDAT